MTDKELKDRLDALDDKMDAIKTMLENILALRGEPDFHLSSVWGSGEPHMEGELTCTPLPEDTEPWHWDPERQAFIEGPES